MVKEIKGPAQKKAAPKAVAGQKTPAKASGKLSAAEPVKKDGRGGARPGAGRKKNSGAFGERTTPMRIPVSILPQVEAALEKLKSQAEKAKRGAGAISPAKAPSKLTLSQAPAKAKDALAEPARMGKALDLGPLLVRKPNSSYALKVKDSALASKGVMPGDYAVIDRSQKPADGSVVAVVENGEIALRELCLTAKGASLKPQGKSKPAAPVALAELRVWGVMVSLARKL